MFFSKTEKIVGFSTLGILAVVGIYIYRQYRLLYDALYTVAGAVVHRVSMTDINFTLLLNVINKGDLSVDITNQNYDVYVNNMFVSHIQYPPVGIKAADAKQYNIHIASNASSTIPLNIQFDPTNLLKAGLQNIGAILADQRNFVVKIVGKFTFKAGSIKMKDFPFEETMTLADITKFKT